jgi:iron complex outermembrane recepter protein
MAHNADNRRTAFAVLHSGMLSHLARNRMKPMMEKTMIRKTGIALGALGWALFVSSSAAWAQDNQANAAEEEISADEGKPIVVTGSRISIPEAEIANPVTSFDSKSITLSGRTNITDLLTQSPALIGSQDSNDNAGSNAGIGTTGLNLLDLRNLGTNRTLVLVDGRRHVASLPGSAAIDVNTIPTNLIERIDIVTGGASAVYGADGVSGVVNFVMKRNFDGIDARGQVGVSSRGDAGNRFFSLAAGKNFADDRGNVTVSYEYSKDDRLEASQRGRLRTENRLSLQRNPADVADDPNVPDRVFLTDIRFFDSSRGGGIDVDFDGLPDFNANGTPWNPGTFVPNFFQQGGDGTPTADYIGDLLPQNARHVVNGLFRYSFSDAFNFFAEGKYVKSKSFSLSQPTFDFFIQIEPDNPFIPANLVPTAVANGGILLNRDNFDLGARTEDIDRETIRTVVGFDGDISSNAKYELSYVYGQSKVVNLRGANRFNDRFFAAIDSVVGPGGAITCRSNLDPTAAPNQPFASSSFPGFLSFTPGGNSGCVPLNLFGEGAPSQAAIDFVTTTSQDTSKLTQNVISGSLSGDFGSVFELPGGGAVGFALGAEYRRETSRSTPAPEDTSGATFGNIIFPSRGKYDVKEAFAELKVPLLTDQPFAQTLSFGTAIRFSDYSTIGGTTTWKVDGVWAPIRDIRFRGTYAQAVRAPNISELFDANSQTFEFITDPCDNSEQANGASTRAANCAALLTALGVASPATFNDTNSASIAGFSGGNPNLLEETAKTKTFGVVVQPSFIKGLTLTADWYDVKLKNAINQVSAQELADLCVDQATIANVFCAAITRQNGGLNAGRITGFNVQPQNVANFQTRGLDFTANYQLDAGDIGNFNFRLVGGYLDKLTFIGTPGADPVDNRNQSFAPKWIGTLDLTYSKGPFLLNYGINYFGRTLRFDKDLIAAQPDITAPEFIKFKEKWEHDIQMSYDVDERFNIYAGVNNLFDQKPDIGATFVPVSAVGRYFYVGASVKLQDLF